MRTTAVSTVLLFALYACSEAVESGPDSGTPSKDASSDTSSGGSDSGGQDSGNPTGDAGGAVINEISGRGKDWVELFNAGTSPADLGGYTLCDAEKDGGAPKLAEGVKLASGTTLAPGAYLLAVQKESDGGVDCLGAPTCVSFDFGISNSEGDRIYLIDPSGTPVQSVDYPANVVGDDGGTWGRLPNGTGNFTSTRGTPAAANQAP
jgi:hypothetical protein